MLGRGPSPMALGPYAFRGLGFGFEEQSREIDTPWAELNVVGRMDALHWTGPKSESFGISGVIFEEAFGGQASLDGIRAAATTGLPLMLVTGAGRVHGLHVVFGIHEDRSHIRSDGMARMNAYEIRLRKYTPGGAAGGIISLF